MFNNYEKAASLIIHEQERIMGPVALELAKKVSGLIVVDSSNLHIEGNPVTVLKDLLAQYESLFGRVSIEVSNDILKENRLVLTASGLVSL